MPHQSPTEISMQTERIQIVTCNGASKEWVLPSAHEHLAAKMPDKAWRESD